MAIPVPAYDSVKIRGRLQEINLKRRTCRVYLSPRGYVRCSFQRRHETRLRELLDSEVTIVGAALERDANGNPREVLIHDIEPIPVVGEKKPTTASELLDVLITNGLVGMWEDRTDIGDSSEFARKLRQHPAFSGNFALED